MLIAVANLTWIVMLLYPEAGTGSQQAEARNQKWVASWAASAHGPYPSGNASAQPTLDFAFESAERGATDQTFRLILKPDLWGSRVRLRFSNAFGTQPVTFDDAFVGLQATAGTLVTGTNQRVTFDKGKHALTLPPGSSSFSDPIALPFVQHSNVALMKAGIAGIVKMECVVQTDGTPSDIRVVAPLDPTVDAAAIQALKGWKFSPGQKDGQAVPVLVQVEMSFTTVRGPRLGSTDVFRSGPGITLPKLVHETKPSYSATARNAGVQGNVVLDCVILTDGTVGDVRVSKPLDSDLDAEAIRTVRQWKFTPGEKEGQPVPVQVSVELTFTLR